MHTCIYIYSNLWSLFQAGMEELVKAVASLPPPLPLSLSLSHTHTPFQEDLSRSLSLRE